MLSENIGYLFLCDNRTQIECLRLRLFGLTLKSLGWVQEIKKGTSLFLYNINSDALFGTFKASCEGGYNINPRAWEGRFPAQVMVEFEILHKLDSASKKFPFVRKSVCKLNAEQTKALADTLEKSQLYDVV